MNKRGEEKATMEGSSLFRKKSIDRIQSPEQLNDYLRVANPAVWVLLAAILLLLAGAISSALRTGKAGKS